MVPLKKQRTGKFLKPSDNPDEMNLEEVSCKKKKKKTFLFSLFKFKTGEVEANLGQLRAGGAGDETF